MSEYTDHLYCTTFPYITAEELRTCCKDAADLDEDDPRLLDAIDDASLVLYYLTGKQFSGTCTATVRPPCLSGGCHCGCTPNQINLGLWPVTDLTSVRYEGVTYTGSALTDEFHILGHRYLARKDGESFRTGNQWAVSGGEFDTLDDGYVFEVEIEYGLTGPRLLTRAARALACQFVIVCCTDKPCKLPDRVTSITRSNISMEIGSVMELLEKGRTGIFEVDLAISVFNPKRLQSPSFLWMPNKEYGRKS